jgi:hypothetical protein
MLKREHLVSTAVGEYRPRPGYKPVQATGTRNKLVPRAKVQMVRVAQDYGEAEELQLFLRHGFNSALGPNRHENRGEKSSMGCVQHANPRFGSRAARNNAEGVRHIRHRN